MSVVTLVGTPQGGSECEALCVRLQTHSHNERALKGKRSNTGMVKNLL